MISKSFTLKDFEHITGIEANVLRVWKKRYGILQPKAEQGGRLHYDQDDLNYLTQVKMLLDSGLKISRVARLSRSELQENVHSRVLSQEIPLPDYLENRLITAITELDQDQLNRLFSELMEHYRTFSRAMLEGMLPFLKKVGRLWSVNALCTAEEHLISGFVSRKLHAAIDRLPPIGKKPTHLLFMPDGELHEIPLLTANYLLLEGAVPTLYFGASVPEGDVTSALQRFRISDVLTGWSESPRGAGHRELLGKLARDFPQTAFWVFAPEYDRHELETARPNNLKLMDSLGQYADQRLSPRTRS